MASDRALNIDESPINRDWLHTKWDEQQIPPYKTRAFLTWLDDLGMTLPEFKSTGLYQKAVSDGLIINDKWVGKRKL